MIVKIKVEFFCSHSRGFTLDFIHKTKWGFLFVWVVFIGISFINLNVDLFFGKTKGDFTLK